MTVPDGSIQITMADVAALCQADELVKEKLIVVALKRQTREQQEKIAALQASIGEHLAALQTNHQPRAERAE